MVKNIVTSPKESHFCAQGRYTFPISKEDFLEEIDPKIKKEFFKRIPEAVKLLGGWGWRWRL